MGRFLCIELKRFSQVIKDITGGNNNYIDTYYFCSVFKKRIKRNHCLNCKFYNPLIKNEKSI